MLLHVAAGISWSALDMDDFACAPELSSIDASATAVEMENATLRCEVDSTPPSSTSIQWSINGRPIRNMSVISFGRQLYVIHEEESLRRLKTSVLTIVNVFMKDSGTYLCTASNRAGNVSAMSTLFVQPREEFGTLTAAEIVGVILGFLLTIIVLVGAVYMVMQQYARYCEERAASAAHDGSQHKYRHQHHNHRHHHHAAHHQTSTNGTNHESSRAKSSKASLENLKAKTGYETMVSLGKDNHVGVDLVNSTAKPFTELGNCSPSEKHVISSNESASGSSSGIASSTTSASDSMQMVSGPGRSKEPPVSLSSCPAAGGSSGAEALRSMSPSAKLSNFEKNNASLVNAIASELEEKIANRVIENLTLRNRQKPLTPSSPKPEVVPEEANEDVPPPAPPCAKDYPDGYAALKVQRQHKQHQQRQQQSHHQHQQPQQQASQPPLHHNHQHKGGKHGGVPQVSARVVANVQANPLHNLERQSRDSPDEGLGDEREYETEHEEAVNVT